MKKFFIFLTLCLFAHTLFAESTASSLAIPLHVNNISFNPTLEQDFSSLFVSRQINCQLIRNESGNISLDAAEDIKFLTPTRLLVHLKKDVIFTDGTPLTSEDAIASLNFLKKKRTVLKNSLNWIQSTKKIDDRSFEIILKKHYPQFLSVFSAPNYALFPKKFLDHAENNPNLWQKPITCGAYKIEKNTQSEMFLKPRKNGLPIHFVFLPAGEISADEAKQFDLILMEVRNPEKLSTTFNQVQVFNPFQFFYVPNTNISPWNDKKSRCALLSKLDPSSIMRAYGGIVKQTSDLIPSGTLGYENSHYQENIKHAAINIPLPRKSNFCFSYIQSSLEENIRGEFQTMFEKIYPNVSQRPLKNSVFMAKKFQETHCDGVILALTSNYFDAYEYLLIFSEQEANVSGYKVQALIHSIYNSQNIVSRAERAEVYRNIVDYLQNQCLIYPLFTMPYEVIFAKKDIDPRNIGKGSLSTYLLTQAERR